MTKGNLMTELQAALDNLQANCQRLIELEQREEELTRLQNETQSALRRADGDLEMVKAARENALQDWVAGKRPDVDLSTAEKLTAISARRALLQEKLGAVEAELAKVRRELHGQGAIGQSLQHRVFIARQQFMLETARAEAAGAKELQATLTRLYALVAHSARGTRYRDWNQVFDVTGIPFPDDAEAKAIAAQVETEYLANIRREVAAA